MKYRKELPLLFLLLIGVLFTLQSCKKDDGNSSEPIEISLNDTEARPLQILNIEVSGMDALNASYLGSIGEIETEFYPSNESNSSFLVCVVPEDISTGAHELSIEIDGSSYTSSINILANEPVSTPDDVFDQYYNDYTTAEYIDFIDEVELENALNELRALPQDEKILAAQMLANNRVILDDIAQLIADTESETGLEYGKQQACGVLCVIGGATAIIGAFISAPVVTAVGLGVLAGLVARALKPVLTALWEKVSTGVTSALRLGYDRMAYITELVYDEAIQMISNKTEQVPDTIYIENGSPLKLAIKTVREPLISESNRSTYTEVNAFLEAYYRLKSFLQGTDYQVPELESGEISDFAGDLNDFSISVDNSLVTVSNISGTPQLAEVSFDSPQEGAHIFNFTYSYENIEGTVSSFTQTARLLNINTYGSFNGPSVNFSASNNDELVNARIYNGNQVRIWLGNASGSISPDSTGTTGEMDDLYLELSGYNGVGTYTAYSLNTGEGISNFNSDVNLVYDYDIDDFGGANHCSYFSGAVGGNGSEGISGSVTITDEEQIGPYLVLEGSFDITLTVDANTHTLGQGTCNLPATFTGNFRVAAEY